MRGTRGILAAAGLAAVATTVTGTGPAGAGEGDRLRAETHWTYEFEPTPGQQGSCSLSASGSLDEYDGRGGLTVLGDWYCQSPGGLRVELRYTDRFGNPATVRATGSYPSVSVEADDVGTDLVVTATARFRCEEPGSPPAYCETSRTIEPK